MAKTMKSPTSWRILLAGYWVAVCLGIGLVAGGCASSDPTGEENGAESEAATDDQEPATDDQGEGSVASDADSSEELEASASGQPEPATDAESDRAEATAVVNELSATDEEPAAEPRGAAEEPSAVEEGVPDEETVIVEETPVVAESPTVGGGAEPGDFIFAADLAEQLEEYVEDLEGYVETEEEYNDMLERLDRTANTVVLISVALGNADAVKAAQAVASADSYAAAQTAVAEFQAAVAVPSQPGSLEWTKVASFEPLMTAVPQINVRLKKYLRDIERYEGSLAAYSAVLAVIAHGSIANAEDTIKPDAAEKWTDLNEMMRDAAADIYRAARAGDKDAAAAANEVLQQSCHDCHEIFNPDE